MTVRRIRIGPLNNEQVNRRAGRPKRGFASFFGLVGAGYANYSSHTEYDATAYVRGDTHSWRPLARHTRRAGDSS